MAGDKQSIGDLKSRLDEIVEAVSDENIDLDVALGLYEEAVALGMRACDLLEEGLIDDEAEDASCDGADEAAETEGVESGEGSVEEASEEFAAPRQDGSCA